MLSSVATKPAPPIITEFLMLAVALDSLVDIYVIPVSTLGLLDAAVLSFIKIPFFVVNASELVEEIIPITLLSFEEITSPVSVNCISPVPFVPFITLPSWINK